MENEIKTLKLVLCRMPSKTTQFGCNPQYTQGYNDARKVVINKIAELEKVDIT